MRTWKIVKDPTFKMPRLTARLTRRITAQPQQVLLKEGRQPLTLSLQPSPTTFSELLADAFITQQERQEAVRTRKAASSRAWKCRRYGANYGTRRAPRPTVDQGGAEMYPLYLPNLVRRYTIRQLSPSSPRTGLSGQRWRR